MEKSVIIIGAGLAGLSAGCYAQMNGYKSCIFEHHVKSGGVASTWNRNSYTIDGGIHFFMNDFQAGGKQAGDWQKVCLELGGIPRLVPLTGYGRFIDENSGKSIIIGRDLEELRAELKNFSPWDAEIIDDLINGALDMQKTDLLSMETGRPPELTGVTEYLSDLWNMRKYLPFLTGSFAQSTADYMKKAHDPWLRQLIRNLFLPEAPVWFVLMVLAALSDGMLSLLPGGCREYISNIEKRYLDLGGQIAFKSTVEEILVSNRKAVGIRLADGSEYYADAIISAADGHSTIFRMLKGNYTSKAVGKRYQSWPLFRPSIMISYGIDRTFEGEPVFNIFELKEPIMINNQTAGSMFVRIFNYDDHFAPPGKTVVQAELETEWQYWNDLHSSDKAAYNAEKSRVASEVLKRLENHYPGISGRVEMTDVATPYTLWRYTLNHHGAPEGWLLTPKTITSTVKRTLPGLQNFYMAGQWVMPGGGVQPCIYSGRQAIQLLCRREKRKFVTSTV